MANKLIFPNFRRIFEREKNKIAREVGSEAVRHFKENFQKEGFVDGSVHKWKDVKRRDPSSPWYGFEYRGETRKTNPVKYGKRGKKLKKQKKLNFSKAATTRKILTGASGELGRSLQYKVNPSATGHVSVSITSDKPYATLHNEGGTMKVFGKHSVRLTARPFVGNSRELNQKIDRIVLTHLEAALQRDNS